MHSLPIFVRLGGRRVILLGTGDAADAKRRLLARAGAQIVGEEDEAMLAIVAIGNDADAAAAIARLQARGILVNAVDRAAACDFTLPAIVDRSPVLVAIGTGGASAGLAKALRHRIEALLPASVGALARALGDARAAIRTRWPDQHDRRRAIDTALEPGGMLDPLARSTDALPRWLATAGDDVPAAIVAIRLRSTDPDDLTVREARLLGQADRIHHPAGVPAAILDRARADAVRIAAPVPAGASPGLTIDLDFA